MSEETAASPSKADDDKKTAKKSTPKEVTASTTDKGKRKRYRSTHPTTIQMAIEAIEALHESEGSSVQAIKGWICDNYHTVRPNMIKSMLRHALHKGVENGLLVRPKKLNTTAVLSGRYSLGAPVKAERPEGVRTSSRISRIERKLQKKNTPSKKRPLSMPFGKRRRKKKTKEKVYTANGSNETNATEPSKAKSAKAKTAKKDNVVVTDSAPKEDEKPPEKPAVAAEKPKEEKKKSEPVKNESSKSETKNESIKPPSRKSRKKT